jgi:hypothetical protein
MTRKKGRSNHDLLRGKSDFDGDPYWFRLVVIGFNYAFLAFALWPLQEWVVTYLAIKGISIGNIVKLFKCHAQ